ncbi:MAG: CoB--CoM heterodisulfide reductase iron-sulfur subunit A family protein [Deltaproteobacteria bacterium]|nr:MAG: CoB--CoM heterodisulfide reductase iron-sulfur subunit A family protein [Deltaproteobacteria bacterium]
MSSITMADGKVLIIGGGVAGLSAALGLARLGLEVQIVEKKSFLGGHAIRFSCKATDRCVKCGACRVEETLKNVTNNPKIKVWTETRVINVSKANTFTIHLSKRPEYINPRKCTRCGACFDQCPESGALIQGYSKYNFPFVAICEENCSFMQDRSCCICQEICPEAAIQLDGNSQQKVYLADAIIIATGFQPFNPESKPYGYNSFPNVITNLQLEEMLKRESIVLRPSDNTIPKKIAFIQCVGSRDAKLNHLWCSKVCCASALRLARLIKSRQPEIEISFFYIDVQTFGRDFQAFYAAVQNEVRMIRNIPGDIYQTEDKRLQVNFYDAALSITQEEIFDMVALSIGITPSSELNKMVELFELRLDETGFAFGSGEAQWFSVPGVYTAGTASGPMSIAETVASASQAVTAVAKLLRQKAG